MDKLKRRIEEVLVMCGVPVSVKGFRYIPEACEVLEKEPNIKITVMYAEVAKKFGTTASRVERAIRHAFQRGYKLGDKAVYGSCLGNVRTNSNCLKMLLWNVKREMEEKHNESTD